jgi:hypothetical protein
MGEMSGCVGRPFWGIQTGVDSGLADIVDMVVVDCVKTSDSEHVQKWESQEIQQPTHRCHAPFCFLKS